MASLKTHIIVRLLTLWNYLTELFQNCKNECIYFYTYIRNYFSGSHDIWVWLQFSTYPISIDKVDNSVYIDWYYNNHTKLLDHYGPQDENEIFCKCSWLSTNLRILDSNTEEAGEFLEFNIDDFIQKFRVKTTEDKVPTLLTIFLAWCIHSKQWFCGNAYIEFNIIDEFGEIITYTIDEHNECVQIKQNKIYVLVDSMDDNVVKFTNNIVNNNVEVSQKNKDI